ncbi:MAG TPA: acyltransferase [Candidatus Saccharimonadales bacterium]|nr:acyltransferase [Candidatus Saccharimonadales bacterium]
MENENNEEKKAHIYEIDFLRAITVFSVVIIHTFASCAFLYSRSTFGTDAIALFIHLLHYNREIFVFVTGLVLTYVYYHRAFSPFKFWSKRLLFIFIPYILWSLIYVWINNSLNNFWMDILTGNASYQLYYISLALQYYLLFPFFLWFIKKISHHPIAVILISFILQVAMIYFDFAYLQKGPLTQTSFVKNVIIPYQDRLFITYQFFFIAGSIVAIYMNKIYAFVKNYGRLLSIIFAITFLCYSIYFLHQLHTESMTYALSVLQPSVIFYSIAVIPFFSWLSILWVGKKKLFRLIKGISDTSFGIFFVHVMILTYFIQHVIPIMPAEVPTLEKIIFTSLMTFILSLIICLILLRIPFLRWTIGRGGQKR